MFGRYTGTTTTCNNSGQNSMYESKPYNATASILQLFCNKTCRSSSNSLFRLDTLWSSKLVSTPIGDSEVLLLLKREWRLGLFYHRFKSWRDFDSFCIGKCSWAFRITSRKFWFLRRKAILRLAMHCIWGLIYRIWKRVLHCGKQVKEWSFWEGRMGGSMWLTQNGAAERGSR